MDISFTLTIESGNDSLTDGTGANADELHRILTNLADRVRYGAQDGDSGAVLDFNGNTVGRWELVVSQ